MTNHYHDEPAQNASPDGEFVRDTTYIEDRIVADIQPGTQPQPRGDNTFHWPVEPGRYRLMAARACPWAHRTIITRRLLGLEDVISLGLAGPTHGKSSWKFDLDPGEKDPVTGIHRLQEAYFNRFPDYPRGITVPAIVEEESAKVVTNNFPQIPVDFIDQWAEFHRKGAPDLYPEHLREEMEPIITEIYHEVNNGVYRCGFAGSQEAYDEAYERLWKAMDWLEQRLSTRRFLMGEHITLADIYLFPTLVRFDPVYYSHFKCSRHKITEIPNLWGYLKELFQTPGFGDTTDFTEIKQHYFITHAEVNPTQIVPAGPDMSTIMEPHGRDHLPGSPFSAGTTLPGPVPAGEEVKHPEPFQRDAELHR
ncbi:glutathione S-transferase family protein [Corynebacterium cystitidis]|uniref:Putative glutathione S-transferase n=1 Tax=Corynebacterium cystitidis DSM 20524 TaxID=1121357 RepID=A0A1H9S5K6_9CORY|nr:glutathione S-transferase family protein [Corynebacterium cystitidis]WJY82220.1 Glutathionyl-hydroquinone reductase YqjG [Corynebacterium cystitidis DSM 20524]SER80218.1 putative glutathione S-transferase [Corynebacterium cystitidis DSM 20524]SNV77658.1 glutathione S-transferase [Corynebacterium cystitidis]